MFLNKVYNKHLTGFNVLIYLILSKKTEFLAHTQIFLSYIFATMLYTFDSDTSNFDSTPPPQQQLIFEIVLTGFHTPLIFLI